ncbi:hypothetical protein PI87_20495 [Ralstonia sp. A12]|uniref:hypothetical protein n=1 Tax=Ralstonia sp. A12 TaxID=1217052 RepID=UPI0005739527|nr:hypothetical protein [Ralstonia sp. A12]KHK51926.1 hypothetical protein PI87_20495 [Ralstonia sp. A12]
MTLDDALQTARVLLSREDKVFMQTRSVEEAVMSLHLTLGYQLRSALSLWSDAATPLILDMARKLPECPPLDADSASSALIRALWHEFNNH